MDVSHCSYLLITQGIKRVFVDGCLSQEQEHEADIIGAAISKAAGCSNEHIIEAMARCHIHNLLSIDDAWLRTGQQVQHASLGFLQELIPRR